MLHEVLLALSGHPSPLFNESRAPSGRVHLIEDFPLLTPAETALLRSIGRLAERHRQLRQQVAIIAATHPSIIHRAVATSIQQTHLARFQQKILDVEDKILSRDSSTVGAYNIVPLAIIVGEFDDWHRRMLWYHDIAQFMQPLLSPPASTTELSCTGAALIDRLRAETNTGFVEIEKIATELSKVAEIAWLRQLVSWLLYGKLPINGAQDFFIQPSHALENDDSQFRKNSILLPSFVSSATASSILFVGKSLFQIDIHTTPSITQSRPSIARTDRTKLASEHLACLSALPLPLVPFQFSQAISIIRHSLSKNVLQHLLPMKTTMQVLACLRQFFLLSRSEFAVVLLGEAQRRLEKRENSMGQLVQQDAARAMRNLSIKDTELQQTLFATWKALTRDQEDLTDDLVDFARSHVTLTPATKHDVRPSSSDSIYNDMPNLSPVVFDDLLFPSATSLGLTIAAPVDLFISAKDVQTYSVIFSYLLSLRRAQLHLSDLWRSSSVRRDRGKSTAFKDFTYHDTHDTLVRRRNLRKIWATCSAALFLISELSNYLDIEIVRSHYDHFENWAQTSSPTPSEKTSAHDESEISQKDPETLAAGHRAMLACLIYALLLTDVTYTQELRSLLGNIDSFIGLFSRLLMLQARADTEREVDGEVYARTAEEEQIISLELERSRRKVDGDLKSVLARLRALDLERVGSSRQWNLGPRSASEYTPWRGSSGLERLLMKLEFGRMLGSSSHLGRV